jgi:hypothetical protein
MEDEMKMGMKKAMINHDLFPCFVYQQNAIWVAVA